MAHEQLDRLESFRVFITAAEEGAAIPPVAEHDLKCLHELCVERAKHYCGKDGVVSIDSMARACSPDANLPAVWLRHAQLRSLYRQGLLAEWQHGTDLDDAVFRLAATIPMNGIHLDQEAFVRHLRAGTAQPELTSRSPQLLQNLYNTHWVNECKRFRQISAVDTSVSIGTAESQKTFPVYPRGSAQKFC